MTGADATIPAQSTLKSLRALAPHIAGGDVLCVAQALAPFVAFLRESCDASAAREAVDAASAVCRALYSGGRSAEALALARGLLEHCERNGDRAQTRRAAGVCGLLTADVGDLVEAIQFHVRALRIAAADEERMEMARTWGNIGSAISVSGRHELAAQCFRRSLALLEPVVQPSHVRYSAHANLAHCLYHLESFEAGLCHAEDALAELDGLPDEDAYDQILLRRNLARLLIALKRPTEAEEHVVQALVLAENAPSARAAIAADITRAAHELALGNADFALTRIERTLTRARQVPATLHDTLACAVRAEEAAGYPARALMRLRELTEHHLSQAIERARKVIEAAGVEVAEPVADFHRGQARERLASMLDPPSPPVAWGALRRLAASAALRMDATGWHGVRVAALVKGLALEWGCGPLEALELGLASELHDIGMGSIPAAVLSQKRQLNESERQLVHRHAEAGAAILLGEPHPRLLLARDIARYHHARWDGAGYPDRVAGSSIPLGARMCAIADAYDAMVCGLAGQPPSPMGEALRELQRQAGRQFDPELVSCFATIVNGGLEGLGLDPDSAHGMEAFQELIASLKENRGFV